MRVDAIKDSQQRSRIAFFVSTITSAILFGVLWNEFLSWDIEYALLEQKPAGWGQDLAYTQLVRNWADSQFVSVSLLGIRFSADDIQVLGSIALFIVALNLCMCLRRENHEIGTLLNETSESPVDVRQMAYVGVRSTMVFSATGPYDDPFNSLGTAPAPPPDAAHAPYRWRLLRSVIGTPGYHVFFMRSGILYLMFLPAVALVTILLSDLFFSVLFHSPYHPESRFPFLSLSPLHRAQLIAIDLFTLAVSIPVFGFCRRSAGFVKGTREMVSKYRERHIDLNAPRPRSCTNCGYDLAGLGRVSVCPECGGAQ
jgi:hypothetical protein